MRRQRGQQAPPTADLAHATAAAAWTSRIQGLISSPLHLFRPLAQKL